MKRPRQNSKARARHRPGACLAAVDQALGACDNIGTLAELLAAAQVGIRSDLPTEVVTHTGHMIAHEAKSVRGFIGSLRSWTEFPQRALMTGQEEL